MFFSSSPLVSGSLNSAHNLQCRICNMLTCSVQQSCVEGRGGRVWCAHRLHLNPNSCYIYLNPFSFCLQLKRSNAWFQYGCTLHQRCAFVFSNRFRMQLWVKWLIQQVLSKSAQALVFSVKSHCTLPGFVYDEYKACSAAFSMR